VVTFPGSLDDGDAARAVRLAGAEPVRLWHADPQLHGVDAVVLPGGFSYGDYLRCGAIARFAAVMAPIVDAARAGLPVLGICNGFQILCEAHLLPGALTRNQHLHFRNRDQVLRIESAGTAWTNAFQPGQEVLIPVKNGEGCYVADAATLDQLEAEGRVVTQTGPSETSPRSPTPPETSSASCPTRSTRWRSSPAPPWTASASSPRRSSTWWGPRRDHRRHHRSAHPPDGRSGA